MGTEAFWVPAVLSLVGAGASYYANNQAAKRQNNAALAGIQQQEALQKQANARVAQTIGKVASSNPQQYQQQDTKQYLTALQQARAAAQQGYGTNPNPTGGNALQSWINRDNAAQTAYANQSAGNLAAVEAPQQQRMNEGFQLGNLGSDLGATGINSRNDYYLTNMAVNAAKPNPWLLAFGQAAQGAAGAYGGK